MTRERFAHRPHFLYESVINSREIIRAIQRAKWEHVGTTGNHRRCCHPMRPDRETVPHPKRDLPTGTLRSIEKQSGVKLR